MRKASVAIAATLLASLAAPVAAHAETVTTRVLILGDSVTHGQNGDHTWRYYTWQALDGAAVDFVGPNRGTVGADYFDGTYADEGFDQDHAARWGLSMWETLYWNSDTAPGVASLMAHQPDVIVETLGVNDLLHMNQTPEQTIGHLENIVGQARAINPDVDFVFGSLPQVWFEKIAAYNELLPAAAAALSTPESRVVVTPTASLELGTDTYDAAHPTNTGDQKIAAAVSTGLAELGIGSGPKSEPAPVVAPEPQPVTPAVVEAIAPPTTVALPTVPSRPTAVKATRRGKVVKVRWEKSTGADAYRVRCGGKGETVDGSRAKIRATSKRCKVQAVNEVGSSPWRTVTVRR